MRPIGSFVAGYRFIGQQLTGSLSLVAPPFKKADMTFHKK